MKENEFGITQFVRGMAWHDAGKPFAMPTGQHAPLGYWLLRLAGYPGEAEVALAHGNSSNNKTLRNYFRLGGQPLPAILRLCNLLDQLAADVYSLNLGPLQTGYHTWQNPFSRLYMASPELEKVFAIRHDDLDDNLHTPLRKRFVESLPASWRTTVTVDTIEKATSLSGDTIGASCLPDGRHVMGIIERFMSHYPERTYPAPNDTPLDLHCRLSAILAFVAYYNIREAKPEEWLTARMASTGDPTPIADPQTVLRDHLAAYLVRITFGGCEKWVEEAIRLDDLNGAQVLMARMRAAFKEALAESMGVAELAQFLWISESAFDLVYLLPRRLGDNDQIRKLICSGYKQALAQLVSDPGDGDSLKALLEQDFQGAELDIASDDRLKELEKQLLTLGLGAAVEPIEPAERDFQAFSAAYGRALLKAYQDSRSGEMILQEALDASLQVMADSEKLDMDDVCTVCGTHPVYKDLADRLPDDEFLKKVTHTFREQPDRLCLTCATRRALAHKQVQVDALHQMLAYDAETGRVQTRPRSEVGLDVPSALVQGGELKGNELLDLGAAFVRKRYQWDAERPLDIFPTISYAADSLGNVALLTLDATDAVLDAYDYRMAWEWVRKLTPRERGRASEEMFAHPYKALVERMREKWKGQSEQEQEAQAAELLGRVQDVQPHLARVLAREACISHFYTSVAGRLEEPERDEAGKITRAGIRTLALDTTYPTGRWLVPAMELPRALEVLGRAVAADLLAVPDGALDAFTRRFLGLTVPPLLDGTVVVFKQKFPIYLVLEAERTLRKELAQQRPAADGGWYGLRLALADMRGTLTSRAPGKATVTLDELPDRLELNRSVDRRTVTGRAADLGRGAGAEWAKQVADARLYVRSDWRHKGEEERRQVAKALTEEAFAPVLFLKRMARE
jgi:hypothetical protein